jgi:prepilin-type N-terminal cleavage/methylation domain-containing protein
MSRSKRTNGFTLIEVVIVVVILAMIISVVYSSVTAFLKSKQLIDDERDIQVVAESVLGRLTRELELITKARLLPPCDKINIPKTDEYFRGEQQTIEGDMRADSITFVARGASQYIPNRDSQPALVQISFLAGKDEENGNKISLFRQEWPLISPPDRACEKRIGFPITSQLVSLQFSYFDTEDGRWYDSWKNGERKSAIPSMVAFTLTLKSQRGLTRTYSSVVSTNSVISKK